ncbi:hypothetical protein BHE74_00035118 [Ensete ventricosum]|nr:hypothetical protein BHE74_00035118 [Ensete ventricosum]RZS03221.1 hypothetical protein BHM03_00033370 [Ensete ventricosum]
MSKLKLLLISAYIFFDLLGRNVDGRNIMVQFAKYGPNAERMSILVGIGLKSCRLVKEVIGLNQGRIEPVRRSNRWSKPDLGDGTVRLKRYCTHHRILFIVACYVFCLLLQSKRKNCGSNPKDKGKVKKSQPSA